VRRFVETVVGVVLAAAMTALGQGLYPVWLLAWLAPLPLLILGLRRGWLHAGLAALVAVSLGRVPFAAFLLHALGMPPAVAAAIVVVPALVVAASVLVVRGLALHGAPWSGVLAFPAAMVAAEYAASSGPDGTAGMLAYSQMECLPVLQLASVAGVWGISFLLGFAAAGLAVGLHRRDGRMVVVVAAVVLAVFAWGGWREADGVSRESATVRVGQAATAESPASIAQVISGDAAGAGAILDAYEEEVDALAHAGAQVVVLPEEIVGVPAGAEGPVRDRFSRMAARDHVTLVAGARVVDTPQGRNVAMVFAPAGDLVGTYVKEHLVPGFEIPRLAPGSELLVMDEPVRAGVAICKDMDFPDPAGRYAAAAVDLLLVPAWDFHDDGWLHGRMAIMRGVELGLPMVRSAQGGMLTVSDAFGRVLAQTVTGDTTTRHVTDVPVGHVATLYGRFGDWCAKLAFSVLGGVLVRLIWVLKVSRDRVRSVRDRG
jgi:apolipoprotein N-acyltransferase